MFCREGFVGFYRVECRFLRLVFHRGLGGGGARLRLRDLGFGGSGEEFGCARLEFLLIKA